jgi:putative lipoprotein
MRYAPAKFVNKVWRVAESSGMARGDLVAFLSEGTLVFASRFGKPALGTWKRDGGGLTMIEEGIPYEVEILALSQAEFRIRSHNPGGFVETRLVPAEDTDAPTAADTGVLRGAIAYRERVALPPDAIVEVWLTDVSPLVLAVPVLAEATVRSEGRQVPLAFELRYDPSRIELEHDYAVRAVIRSGGSILFQTEKPRPVITKGNPTQVELWLVRAGEGEPPSAGPPPLPGSAWRLDELGGADVLAGTSPTLEFSEAGKVAGHGSCNRFFGTVEISGDSLRFGPLGSTRMACAEAVLRQEGRYLKALEGAERFGIDGAELLIHSKGLAKPLRFVRKGP